MLTTFVYNHDKPQQTPLSEFETQEINREARLILTAAAERAAVAFLQARTAVNAFLDANSRLQEYTQDDIQVERDELSRTEEPMTQVATDIPSATQRHIEPRWF